MALSVNESKVIPTRVTAEPAATELRGTFDSPVEPLRTPPDVASAPGLALIPSALVRSPGPAAFAGATALPPPKTKSLSVQTAASSSGQSTMTQGVQPRPAPSAQPVVAATVTSVTGPAQGTGVKLSGIVGTIFAARPASGQVALSAEQAAQALGLAEQARGQFMQFFKSGSVSADGSIEVCLSQTLVFALDEKSTVHLGPNLIAKVSADELSIKSGWKVNSNTIDRIAIGGGGVTVYGHRGIFSGSERFPL